MLFSLTAVFLAVVLRVFLIARADRHISSDEAFHYYYMGCIKNNHHSVPYKNEKALGGANYCTYPAFYHCVLSYFPKKFIEKYGKGTSLLYDLLSSMALACVLWMFYGLSEQLLCLSVATYLILPALIFPSLGPRSSSLTPRNFSQCLFAIGYVFLLLYLKEFSLIAVEGAALFCALSILSSKFSLQHLLLQSVGIGLLTLSVWPFVFFVNILVLALIFGRKTFLYQLKGQWRHSQWYMRKGLTFIEKRWQWKRLFALLRCLQLRDAWQIMIFHNPLTRGVILNLPLFFYCITVDRAQMDDLQILSLQMIGVSMASWFLTQFSIFRAFGEPERYIEFSLPSFIFLVFSMPQTDFYFYALFVYALAFFAYSLYMHRNSSHHDGYCVQEIKRCLHKIDDKRILCTSNNESYLFASLNDFILVGFFSNNIDGPFYDFFYSVYPDVQPKHLKALCRQYHISHVIINKLRTIAQSYDVSFGHVIMENDRYTLLKVV
jgi:hypothetical protein